MAVGWQNTEKKKTAKGEEEGVGEERKREKKKSVRDGGTRRMGGSERAEGEG